MPETIEAFVAKLQTEGVEAGQKAAEEITSKANTDGEKIIADAKAKAEKIVADARTEADGMLARTKTEMKLAVRDELLRLQDAASRALRAVLDSDVAETLSRDDVLKALLGDLVTQYVQADVSGKRGLTVTVSDDKRDALKDWAMQELKSKADDGKLSINLKGALNRAGFEYSAGGGTVEVTPDSITDSLMEIVGPELRKLIQAAAEDTPRK